MSFFLRKNCFKCNNCKTETTMQIPSDMILNHATLELVASLTSLISASLCDNVQEKTQQEILYCNISYIYNINKRSRKKNHYITRGLLSVVDIFSTISY